MELNMVIGKRLRNLRERQNLSQGDVETRTGLLRCYVSRVENGHTVPAVETLEKFARALNVPLYRLFYDGDKPPAGRTPSKTKHQTLFGARGSRAIYVHKLRKLLARIEERDRRLLPAILQRMVVSRSR